MLSFNLDSKQSAENLIQLCEKYSEDTEVDVVCGRQIVDGKSILGVMSLLGHFVTLNLLTDNHLVIEKFSDDLERIK